MANIIIPRKQLWYNRKPVVGSQINLGHPLSQGLVGCWLMNEGGGKPLDLTKKAFYSSTTNNPFFQADYFNINSTGIVDYTVPTNKLYNLVGNATFMYKVFVNSNTGDGSVISKTTTNGGSNTPFDIGIYRNGSDTVLNIKSGVANAGPQFKVWAGNTNLYNKISIITIVRPSEMSTSPTMYVNSKKETSVSSVYGGVGTGQATTNNNNVRIGNRNDSATQFKGNIYFIYLWDRLLSFPEIQQLYQEPYCFIAPIIRKIYFTPSAGGGVTINATLINLSAKTFSPTVTTGVSISANFISASLQTFASTITAGAIITPNLISLTIKTFTTSITAGAIISANLVSVKLATFISTITAGSSITTNFVGLRFTIFSHTITAGVVISSSLVSLALSSFSPTVSTSSNMGTNDIWLLKSRIEKTMTFKSRIDKYLVTESAIEKTLVQKSRIEKEIIKESEIDKTLVIQSPLF